jgi:hypothetical protein
MSTRLAKIEGSVSGPLRRLALPLLLLGVVAFAMACSDTEKKSASSGASDSAGNAVASSAGSGTPEANQQPAVVSSASPIATLNPTATPDTNAAAANPMPSPTPTPQAATLADLVPCSGQTYFSQALSNDGVPILVYRGVPVGTPILFPFESGKIRHVDASETGITLTFDVPGVGVVTLGASGSNSLDRNFVGVVRGQQIGTFGAGFPDAVDQPLPGAQLYLVAGSNEPITIDSTFYSGQPLEPHVSGCITP